MDHLFSTEIGERRLHSNPVGTPNLAWIGWKLQKFSLQNFQLIPLSPWVPTFHTQQGGSHFLFTEGVIVLGNRTQRQQRNQRDANIPTSLEHWLVKGCNTMCILRNMIHVPSWYPSIHYDVIK